MRRASLHPCAPLPASPAPPEPPRPRALSRSRPRRPTTDSAAFLHPSGAMAAPDLSTNLQEEATCAICLDYFTDPVMTDCGHNFCRECIRRCWGQPEGPYACPECRELSPQRNLRPNRPLAKMAEMARRLHPPSPVPQGVCAAHREPLAAFCGDELRLLCAACERSGEHWTHRVRPLQDAADDLKGKLEKSLEHLRKQMEDALLFQAQAEETCALWQKMVDSQRQNVLAEFERLRRLLAEEEQRLLQRLEEEELEVLPPLRDSAARLGQQSARLAELIAELEGRCQLPALGLLQVSRSALWGGPVRASGGAGSWCSPGGPGSPTRAGELGQGSQMCLCRCACGSQGVGTNPELYQQWLPVLESVCALTRPHAWWHPGSVGHQAGSKGSGPVYGEERPAGVPWESCIGSMSSGGSAWLRTLGPGWE